MKSWGEPLGRFKRGTLETVKSCIDIRRSTSAQSHFWSLKSLEIAKNNASINNLKIDFFYLDILNEGLSRNRYDIIVSNPPYVSLTEKHKMQRRVVEFEPNNAIFVNNNDPLIFYDQIAQKAKESLNKKGFIFFECNSDYINGVNDILLKNSFSNIEIRSDFRNNKRMIKARNG